MDTIIKNLELIAFLMYAFLILACLLFPRHSMLTMTTKEKYKRDLVMFTAVFVFFFYRLNASI